MDILIGRRVWVRVELDTFHRTYILAEEAYGNSFPLNPEINSLQHGEKACNAAYCWNKGETQL